MCNLSKSVQGRRDARHDASMWPHGTSGLHRRLVAKRFEVHDMSKRIVGGGEEIMYS